MSCSEVISCSFCSSCSVRGTVTVGGESGDPAMTVGEKVRDYEGDHWLGPGLVRGMYGVIAFVRLAVFCFSLVTELSRVALFMF